jgi:isopropylmalate/homocitrate/citramalate synthase
MPAETRKRTRAKMEKDGPKLSPDEELKKAEARVKKARSEAKDAKADKSIFDLTAMFEKMGGKKRRSTKRKIRRVRKH